MKIVAPVAADVVVMELNCNSPWQQSVPIDVSMLKS